MIHLKLTEAQSLQVSGFYGEHQLQPRLALDGFYYLPESVLNLALPENILMILQVLESREITSADFPVDVI
jgi:hypothetical protein